MTPAEVGQLLGYLAAVDNRVPDRAALVAWHDALGDLDFELAMAGARLLRRESEDYATPALVRRFARRAREMARVNARRRAALDAARREISARESCDDCGPDGYRLDRPLKRCRHDGWRPGGLARARARLELESGARAATSPDADA